jgi:hypothetical protein
MGTRGKDQKDADLIGSVTAEIIERARVPVFTIPENIMLNKIEDIKNIAYSTNFEDKDLIAFEKLVSFLKPYNFKIHFIHYNNNDDNWAEIKFGSEKSNPITISKNLVIGGNKVTTIALTTATLVSDYAFSSYTPLTSVDIGDNVVTIGKSAFDGCSMLSNLTLGDKVERFEYRSFGNCDSLTEVIFTNNVKTLCAESFRDCDNLQSIYIPASVEVIEKAAFNYDSSLVSAVFEVTEGWYVSTGENAVTGINIDPEVMEDAKEVAELLSVKMYDDSHYWRRAN